MSEKSKLSEIKKALNEAGVECKSKEVLTTSGIPVKSLYTPLDTEALDYFADLGLPGGPPFTRGVYQEMYRRQLWSQRQTRANRVEYRSGHAHHLWFGFG